MIGHFNQIFVPKNFRSLSLLKSKIKKIKYMREYFEIFLKRIFQIDNLKEQFYGLIFCLLFLAIFLVLCLLFTFFFFVNDLRSYGEDVSRSDHIEYSARRQAANCFWFFIVIFQLLNFNFIGLILSVILGIFYFCYF